jgi:hypothetical protein
VALLREGSVGDTFGERRAGGRVKVRQNRLPKSRVGIAKVIVADAIVDGEPVCDLPLILCESTARSRGEAIVVGKWLSSDWIEGDVGFSKWIVVDQIDDVRIGKDWLTVSAREVRQVISMPALVADFEVVTGRGHR